MNTQQRLADIQNLLQYVKGILDAPAQQEVTTILEEIGQMTLGLVANLRILDDSINTNQKEALASHTAAIANVSQTIMDKLEAVQHTISDANTNSTEGIAEIQTLYQGYKDLSQQCMDTYTQQTAQTTETLNTLCNDGQQTAKELQEIKKVLIDKQYLTAFSDDLATLVHDIKQSDNELDAHIEASMKQLATNIDTAMDTLSNIGTQLHGIEDGFQTSIGRLNIIDIKLDEIVEVVNGHE